MALLPVDQAGNGHREAYPRPLARRALHTKLPRRAREPGASWTAGLYRSWLFLGRTHIRRRTPRRRRVDRRDPALPLYPNVASLGVSSDVRERLLDEARQLLACLIREPGWKIVLYHQFYFVPSTGHPPVQIHEVLERGDHRAVQRLFEAQLEDGSA